MKGKFVREGRTRFLKQWSVWNERSEKKKKKKEENEGIAIMKIEDFLPPFISVRNFDNFFFLAYFIYFGQKLKENFFLYLKRDSNLRNPRSNVEQNCSDRGKKGRGERGTLNRVPEFEIAPSFVVKVRWRLAVFQTTECIWRNSPKFDGRREEAERICALPSPPPLTLAPLSLSFKINPASAALFSYIFP